MSNRAMLPDPVSRNRQSLRVSVLGLIELCSEALRHASLLSRDHTLLHACHICGKGTLSYHGGLTIPHTGKTACLGNTNSSNFVKCNYITLNLSEGKYFSFKLLFITLFILTSFAEWITALV